MERRRQASRSGAARVPARRRPRIAGPFLARRSPLRDGEPAHRRTRIPESLRRDTQRPSRCPGAARSGRRLRRSLAPSGARPVVRPDRSRDLSGIAESVSRWHSGQAGPGPHRRSQGAFRLQGVQGGALLLPSQGLRFGDSLFEGCGRDVSARLHRAGGAHQARAGLPNLGYKEDVQETCGYLKRFHPDAAGVREVCPSNTAEAG